MARKDSEWVMAFLKAVYPEFTELGVVSNTEHTCLVDATELINDLRAKNKRLRKWLEEIVDIVEVELDQDVECFPDGRDLSDWVREVEEGLGDKEYD